jgi:hypothetical protein
VTLHEFHNCDEAGIPQTFKQALRREIRRRQIEDEMARTAKASEVALPADERRQIIDLRELRAACIEVVMACLIVAPIAFGYVICLMVAWA